ncbi:Crp/Fnr family transcriptional regulator [Allorhizobium terrae]|uniref:Crp/Fnr family transcriptional regulator n=1 Tax=Allorhizobium terrae TaxID=1848972 RepID=A0A4S3ZXQ3_9HYPH|nr:Crp/Fnr family transcriptional regulator [Allorhizobium terrae]THF50682.1 Crp/Fnr family transcriptional regulator [Allorhizobium terrae]
MAGDDQTKKTGFLRQIPFFQSLTPEQDQAWSERCETRKVLAGTILYDPERTERSVFINTSGMIRAVLRVTPSKELFLEDFAPGSIVGALVALNGHWENGFLMTITDGEVIMIPPDVFQEILEARHDICLTLLTTMTSRMRQLYLKVSEHSYLDVKHRLYNALLRLSLPCTDNPERRIIAPPLIHAALAEHVGTSRESISREMSRLLQDAVIERNSDAIIIRQPRELLRRLSRVAIAPPLVKPACNPA